MASSHAAGSPPKLLTPNAIGYYASSPPTIWYAADRQCQTCLEDLPLNEFPTIPKGDDCHHQASTSCVACIRSYIETQSYAVPLNEIKCPEIDCSSSIDYNHMRQYASAELFTRYDNYLHTIALQNSPDFIQCANKACSFGGIVDISTTTYTVCSACNTKTCTICKTPWHPDKTHAENLSAAEAEAEERARDETRRVHDETESAREVDAISKACPASTCGARIDKVDGCDHMTCQMCKHEFCWICLVPYNSIRRIGNHAHEESCLHYRHMNSTSLRSSCYDYSDGYSDEDNDEDSDG